MPDSSYTIVGVVGHVDHGKTALTRALTGVDTDTRPEEKQRGITIDLGFAHYDDGDDTIALVDAPGHYKYVSNMLTGMSHVDLGLLVVAADQGIEAQTIEHLICLRGLGVSRLVAVVSKTDLAGDDVIEELSEELKLWLSEQGFEDSPVIPVSVTSQTGIDELRQTLKRAARVSPRDESGDFRMPIDRVFTVEGRGCVVAGAPWSGSVNVGDTLRLVGGSDVRVRAIQSHGASRESSSAGRRTALNLSGVSADEISRGDELVGGSTYRGVTRCVVDLTTERGLAALRCPAITQCHTATKSVEARITGPKQLQGGSREAVVVEFDEPVVAVFGQRCLFRLPHPVGLIGSGEILAAPDETVMRNRRWTKDAADLLDASPQQRLLWWLNHLASFPTETTWLAAQVGIRPEQVEDCIQELIEGERLIRLPSGAAVSSELIGQLSESIRGRLVDQSQRSTNAWLPGTSLLHFGKRLAGEEATRHALKGLIARGEVVATGDMVAIANEHTQLSRKQRARLEQILDRLKDCRTPPSRIQLSDELGIPKDSAEALLLFACEQGMLIDVGQGFAFSAGILGVLRQELGELFERQATLTVAEIRDRWGMSRKHVLPVLEYFDRVGMTLRDGSDRSPGSRWNDGDAILGRDEWATK